ncbi:MAG: carbohydrate binding domain-containing protein [Phycisphaerae bacterium]|nr:carbohydrate binding domain-containing protein [Phycisphaerae bacterium]
MSSRFVAGFAVVLVLGMGPVARASEVPNASFEQSDGKTPTGWKPHTWNGKGTFEHAENGHTGKRSLKISSDAGGDLSWESFVSVRPNATYRLSGWIKTKDLKPTTGRGALINVHQLRTAETPALTGTNDWKRVEVVFDTGERDTLDLNCLFGGWGLATGQAWYDDVKLELISAKEFKPSVTIDATKTGEPINPYIYGQFIEHLGRCIYGGIWAEMLEDRKFFYPVGGKESPWQAVGEPEAVTMVKEGSYVGDQTPRVTLPGGGLAYGISQKGLGLVKGREYVGRVVLAGDPQAGPVEVKLVWGTGLAECQTVTIDKVTQAYQTFPLKFKAGEGADDGQLLIVGKGKGTLRIGTASLMPADNVHGMRADTLKLLKELDAPIYRWPGGNFVSGYNWKDGIGPRDKRPPRKNPAWKGVEHNDFGIDDFMVFCREIKTEPLVVVNTGLGDVTTAVEELQYANGAADTPMGKLRADNGHAEPYNVIWWGIGNEMYGNWQLGHMPLEKYVEKHNAFVDAMRKEDPRIKVVAVGAVGKWSEMMMAKCAGHMDLVSEHFYCGQKPGVLSHVAQLRDCVRNKARAHRRYRKKIDALKGKDIRIAMDEWNYWYGPELYGQIGPRYFLKDALGVAMGLNEFSRCTDIISMANYAQTVNVIGCIKTTKTAAGWATTGLPLKLYRRHYGVLPVTVTGEAMPLDVAAAWTKDRKALTIAVVNPMSEAMTLSLSIRGAKLTGQGRLWLIAGTDPMAYNDPGKPQNVKIEEKACDGVKDKLTVPPLSVSLYSLAVE